MNKKKSGTNKSGFVYSTDPNFRLQDEPQEDQESLSPARQKLRVRLDTKQRAGKAVTLVEGFTGKEGDLEDLGKKIKTFCGTGGAVKDGEIIVQGDQREKVMQWLQKNGFVLSKKT